MEEDSERPVAEITKTMRETLAQRLGYSKDSMIRYLNSLAVETSHAVYKEGKGREVIHRIDLKALEDWIGENSIATTLTLSEEQVQALTESFSQTLERWGAKKILCATPLFHPTSIKPGEGSFGEKELKESGKPTFPPFSSFSGEKEPYPGFSTPAAVELAPAPLAEAKGPEKGAEAESPGKGSDSLEKLEKVENVEIHFPRASLVKRSPKKGELTLDGTGGFRT